MLCQILHHTQPSPERDDIQKSLNIAEKILDNINETIREQEGQERLREISKNLWIGQGFVFSFSSLLELKYFTSVGCN
jgi:hypothetical protein